MRKLADSERAAFEAHIKSLTDQIEWLRAALETATGLHHAPVAAKPSSPMELKLWKSEDEEDVEEMIEAGLIDRDEGVRMLEAVGALSTDIEFAG